MQAAEEIGEVQQESRSVVDQAEKKEVALATVEQRLLDANKVCHFLE